MYITVDSNIEPIKYINVNWINNDILVRSEIHSQSLVDLEDEQLVHEDLLINNVVSDVLLIHDYLFLGQMNVYDMSGLLVYTVINNNNRIDVSMLSQGMYMLQWTDGQTMRLSKFVKR